VLAPRAVWRNHLLEALPADELARLAPSLEPVSMPLGKVLYEIGEQRRYIYFPSTSIVSLLYVTKDGASAEVAVVGREGFLGISLLTNGDSMPNRAVVHHPGHGYRLSSRALHEEFERAGALMRVLLRFTQALITQMTQTAVCNRHHTLDQQLCRWLLLSLDRQDGNRLAMTQELIAEMLGVRRAGVTRAAGDLQRSGMIRYRRGQISVLDRARVERAACECYAVVKREYARLLDQA
jgi:CRP-like cAMP-binding protein